MIYHETLNKFAILRGKYYLCTVTIITSYKIMKEETIIEQTQLSEEICASQVKQSSKDRAGIAIGAAFVSGSIVGSSVTLAGQAVAENIAKPNDETIEKGTKVEEEADIAYVPEITTSNTAPVAQVSDDMSFSQAFAEARRQVGAGGAFVWHGKVYGTYYKNEWDNMTTEEKEDYQSSVDYEHLMAHNNAEKMPTHNASVAQNINTHDTAVDDSASQNSDPIDAEDVDVHVISVEHNIEMNGQEVDVAVIEVDGYHGILVDVDHDGIVEGAIIDFNGDGQIQANEVSPDLSNAQIPMPQMSDGDMFMAQNNNMPDYMNDANI